MEVKKREGKDTEVKHSSEKKREDPDMEVKRCLGKKRKGSYTNAKPCSDLPGKKKKKKKKRERKRRVLFNVIRRDKDNYIHVIDVNRDFLPAGADIKYSGRSKNNRIAGHDCEPPSMWRPYMYFETTGKPGELPKDMAMVALGSEIYLIGGHWDVSSSLPRQVYVIDTAKEYHHSVDPWVRKKKSCVLNQGKRQPIAWTIRGNIYVMPHTFSGKVFSKTQSNSKPAGKLFERYDPDSNSWTILPSPPVENLNLGCAKGDLDPLLVTSHAVLGSRLLISLGTFVLAFDTARTDGGWTKIAIELEHGPRRGLNILPFDPGHSSPLGDNLVLCYPRVGPKNRLSGLLEEKLGIDCRKDYYVCRFDENGDDLKASITPFDGSSFGMRWAQFFRPVRGRSSQVTLLGEDLILFAKVGRDYDSFSFYNDSGESDEEEFLSRWWNRNYIGDTYLSLELFRVSEAPAPDGERRYQASGTRSALFKVDDEDHAFLELFRCFVMEDGIFVN